MSLQPPASGWLAAACCPIGRVEVVSGLGSRTPAFAGEHRGTNTFAPITRNPSEGASEGGVVELTSCEFRRTSVAGRRQRGIDFKNIPMTGTDKTDETFAGRGFVSFVSCRQGGISRNTCRFRVNVGRQRLRVDPGGNCPASTPVASTCRFFQPGGACEPRPPHLSKNHQGSPQNLQKCCRGGGEGDLASGFSKNVLAIRDPESSRRSRTRVTSSQPSRQGRILKPGDRHGRRSPRCRC